MPGLCHDFPAPRMGNQTCGLLRQGSSLHKVPLCPETQGRPEFGPGTWTRNRVQVQVLPFTHNVTQSSPSASLSCSFPITKTQVITPQVHGKRTKAAKARRVLCNPSYTQGITNKSPEASRDPEDSHFTGQETEVSRRNESPKVAPKLRSQGTRQQATSLPKAQTARMVPLLNALVLFT